MTLDLTLDLALDLGIWPWIWTPETGPDWSRDRPLRILYSRYTGFKGLPVASDNLSLTGPRIG